MAIRCEQCVGEVCDKIFEIHAAAASYVTEMAADAELSGEDMSGVDEYLVEHRAQTVTQAQELLKIAGCTLSTIQIDQRIKETPITLGEG